MLKTSLSVLLLISPWVCANESLQRPNILWLTFEDTSAFELSVYGNEDIDNPHIDNLAANGIRFNNLSSNAPYCSPARSTLISGAYATTYGADHHRASVALAEQRLFFPSFLRQAGYFTSNNKKRDYNVKLSSKQLDEIWDEYDGKASYNSKERQPEQPFFAVFNANITHMSRLTSYTLEDRRDFAESGVESSAQPAYLPELPAIQSDYQFHLEGVIDVDKWIGVFVNDLKQRGLFDNTIIFIFSDHGGSSPRGKGFLYHSTGLHTPFVLHVPEAYKHLLPKDKDQLADMNISFVDFAPTILSLAGLASPDEMQGQAFLGKFANHTRGMNFAFRTNQEKHYDPQRGVTDGKYSYVRNYLPRKPLQLRNDFQWGMPSNIALDEYVKSTQPLSKIETLYSAKQSEYLFNLSEDKFEQVDLTNAKQSEHKIQLEKMRRYVSEHIRNTSDLGFIPVSFKQGKAFKDWLPNHFDLTALHTLVETVSLASETDLNVFIKWLNHDSAIMRFWAAQGMAELAAKGILIETPEVLLTASKDTNPAVATVAAEALVYLKVPGAVDKLLKAKDDDQRRSALETIAWTKPQLLKHHIGYFEQQTNLESRVVLAALGKIDASQTVSKKQRIQGREVNRNRRAIAPLPN